MSDTLASARFDALGTTAVLLVAEPDAFDVALDALDREIRAIDLAASRFRPDSELVRVNRAGGRHVAVSPLFVEALDVALRAARLTDGAVSPTVGVAMRLLGYDRDFGQVDRDGPPLVLPARAVPGWQLIEVDHRRSAVRVPAGIELDLGATAKALCADRAAHAAAKLTGAGVLVSLGGDIAAAGTSPADGWVVRVADHHAAGPDLPGQTIRIESGGLATSGTAARRWQRGREVLHHLVDPATGRPAGSCWRTATVAAGSCVDANIASTAAIVLGPAGPRWLADRGLPARLVADDGSVTVVGDWPDDAGSRP